MAYTSTLQKLAESLSTTYQNTIFSHSGDIGDSREKELITFLERVMPKRYGFKSGEVFDKNDNLSGQVDVVIYDNLFSTIFSDGTDKILAPVESTFGVISVKSKMGTKELDHAIQGILNYNSLERTPPKENTIYITPEVVLEGTNGIEFNTHPPRNINCIFAFETTVALETMIKKVKESECIDLLIIPGQVCIIGRNRVEFSLSRSDGQVFENAAIVNEKSISIFILFLQLYLSNNRLVARDRESLILWLVRESKITV